MGKKAIVIGGGAAGMMAAVFLGRNGFETSLYEKNEKLGKKIFITGKGRCNFTNACEDEDFFEAVVSNKKFMYSSYYGFTNSDVISFFEKAGMPVKIERGNRAFPVSDHAYDVTDALKREMKKQKVMVFLNTEVKDLICEDDRVMGIVYKEEGKNCSSKAYADRVYVATGGLSYPSTGSTGDGYRFAQKLGLNVKECRPSLVAFVTKERWIPQLAGLALKNINFTLKNGKKKVYDGFGEMLFTHKGVSGPLVLTASSKASRLLPDNELSGIIDLKPAVSIDELDSRLTRLFSEQPNKDVANIIRSVYPASLVPVMMKLSEIDENLKANSLSKDMRTRLVKLTKELPITVVDTGGYKEAVITQGGVDVKEIDPGTMMSKKINNLFFIGEVLDLDALTGGYNLQIAWSTAHAGANA